MATRNRSQPKLVRASVAALGMKPMEYIVETGTTIGHFFYKEGIRIKGEIILNGKKVDENATIQGDSSIILVPNIEGA
jgi:hypothetical protein